MQTGLLVDEGAALGLGGREVVLDEVEEAPRVGEVRGRQEAGARGAVARLRHCRRLRRRGKAPDRVGLALARGNAPRKVVHLLLHRGVLTVPPRCVCVCAKKEGKKKRQ